MYAYLIVSHLPTLRTYIGITTDLSRRLRQHRGRIKGGAKSTRGRQDWEYHKIVEGPPTAIRVLEWQWKHRQNAKGRWVPNPPGLASKEARLEELLAEFKELKVIQPTNLDELKDPLTPKPSKEDPGPEDHPSRSQIPTHEDSQTYSDSTRGSDSSSSGYPYPE